LTVDAMAFGAADQRVQHRVVLAGFILTGEKLVLLPLQWVLLESSRAKSKVLCG
jgi:hypothetical protein